jgi:hypothetical protein
VAIQKNGKGSFLTEPAEIAENNAFSAPHGEGGKKPEIYRDFCGIQRRSIEKSDLTYRPDPLK